MIEEPITRDHKRFDEELTRLGEALKGDAVAAGDLLKSMDGRLTHHMTWEEEHLYPAVLERCTARERRSIESLIVDHERLRESMANLAKAVSEGDLALARDHHYDLGVLLHGHHYDEEFGVLPEADRYLSEEERKRLLELFQGSA